jgi:undecaprenyl phosphate N,N'-diacetylbacillosamine 1-phosphate transferase
MYTKYLKRPLDIIASLIGVIVLSPIILLIALILFLSNKSNPFFLQPRGGYKNSVFNIIKFKTMNDKKDNQGNLLSDDKRVTKFGKLLRKYSIDELPQLINVLKGNMSLIGPRPFHARYIELYSDRQKQRHNVRPGLTGWAQINGRNNITWAEKFELDLYYVENQSFKLDVSIIIKTIQKVLKPTDVKISKNTVATSFNGNN